MLHSIFDGQAKYQICVVGRLDPYWSDRLEGMHISQGNPVSEIPSTVLVGNLPDQAALIGILNTLYNFHFPLISVERLIPED